MTDFEQPAQFVSWCIEEYAAENKKSSKDVANFFNDSGVLDYLEQNWQILHTQGRPYILSEIDDFIKEKKN